MNELYRELYYFLFNQVTDAIDAIERQNYGTAKEILMRAQQETEDRYLEDSQI